MCGSLPTLPRNPSIIDACIDACVQWYVATWSLSVAAQCRVAGCGRLGGSFPVNRGNTE
jgi:hypothetical protein